MKAVARQQTKTPAETVAAPETPARKNRFRRSETTAPGRSKARVIPLHRAAPGPEKARRSTAARAPLEKTTQPVSRPPAEAAVKGKPSGDAAGPLKGFIDASATDQVHQYKHLAPSAAAHLDRQKAAAVAQTPAVKINIEGARQLPRRDRVPAAPKQTNLKIDNPQEPHAKLKAPQPLNFRAKAQAQLTEAQLGDHAVDTEGRQEDVAKAVDQIRTESNIVPSAGDIPEMPLSGSSDPKRAEALANAGRAMGAQATEGQRTWLKTLGKAVDVPAVALSAEGEVRLDETPAAIELHKLPVAADKYAAAKLPPALRNASDRRLHARLEAASAKTLEQVTAAEASRTTGLAETQAAHETAIAQTASAVRKQREQAYTDANGQLETASETAADALKTAEPRYREDIQQEQKGAVEAVTKRAENDNQSARRTLADAEKKANDKIRDAEKEARKKKGTLQKNNGEASLWDQFVDAIRSAVNTVVQAINEIFESVRKEVQRLINAARNAAMGLLEKGRQWIVARLDTCRKQIQDKLDTYLKRFPEIQSTLSKAADTAFDTLGKGINAAAERLQTAVTALGKTLAAGIDKVLAAGQKTLTTVVRLYGAVWTGNFKDAFRIVFLSACEILNVDPERVLAFIHRLGPMAEQALEQLVKFGGNVVKAGRLGLDQFTRRIKKHLLGGVIAWLTGALGGAGIVIPERFDAKGVLALVMSVMGLTYARIRKKVVKRLGPGGEAKVAQMEAAAGLLGRLFKEGPAALWEDLKETAATLPKQLIAGLVAWLRNNLIVQAIKKLVAMLFPVAAILDAVSMIYGFATFLVERFEQIKDFVKSVYGAVVEMYQGQIQKAADAVEASMARSLPVMLGFLASLIGLGGIGGAVRKMITKLRKPIDKVVDKVVKRLVRLGRRFVAKGKAAAKRLSRWWQARRRFTTKGGEAHEVSFKGEGKRARLMVKSTPKTYEEFLDEVKQKLKNKNFPNAAALQQSYSRAVGQFKALNSEVDSRKKTVKDTGKPDPELDTLEPLLNATKKLMEALEESEQTDLPVTPTPEYDGLTSAGFSKGMTVAPLTMKGTPGSRPTVGDTKIWTDLNLRRDGGGSYYIKGHLLNDNIHGPGNTWNNLVPLSRKGNKRHEKLVEDDVKQAVIHDYKKAHRGIIYYRVYPQDYYPQRGDSDPLVTAIRTSRDDEEVKTAKEKIVKAEAHVPKSLVCEAFGYDVKKKAPNQKLGILKRSPLPVPNEIDQNGPGAYLVGDGPRISRELVSLNLKTPYPNGTPAEKRKNRGLEILAKVPGIGEKRALVIWNARQHIQKLQVDDKTNWGTLSKTIQGSGLPTEIISKLKAYESHPKQLFSGETKVSPAYED